MQAWIQSFCDGTRSRAPQRRRRPRRHRAPRLDARSQRPAGTHRRSRSLSSGRRPRKPRAPITHSSQFHHVRPAWASLRLLHVRHALDAQRHLARGRARWRGACACRAAPRRAGSHAVETAESSNRLRTALGTCEACRRIRRRETGLWRRSVRSCIGPSNRACRVHDRDSLRAPRRIGNGKW